MYFWARVLAVIYFFVDKPICTRDIMVTVIGMVLSCLMLQVYASPEGSVHDFCLLEEFNATCPTGKVIMMTSAEYGRMRVGRCIPTDYNTGCSADVMNDVDERCSGRDFCKIAVPDPTLNSRHTCRTDLLAYFTASYSCVPVINPLVTKKIYCSQKIDISNMTEGYIASSVTSSTQLGSRQCPWQIIAAPGQSINVTLYDFSARLQTSTPTPAPNRHTYDTPKSCPIYVNMEEGDSAADKNRIAKSIPFCGHEERRRWIHTTKSNTLRIQINLSKQNAENVNFILHFSVTGCPDIPPLAHARIERTDGGMITISCNYTQETWHLVCKDTKWIGEYHNCSSAHNSQGANRGGAEEQGFPLGLLIAIAIGVVVGVVLGFVFLIVIFVCRRRERQENKHDSGNPLMGAAPVDPDQQNIYRLVEVRPPPMMCDCQFTPGTDHKSLGSMDNTLMMQPPGECIYRTSPRVDPGECPYQSRDGDTYQPQNMSPLKTCDIISDIHVPDNFQCCEGPEWYTATKQQYLRSQSDTYPRIPPFPGFTRGDRGTMPRNQMPSCDSGNATDVSDASTAASNTTSFQPTT